MASNPSSAHSAPMDTSNVDGEGCENSHNASSSNPTITFFDNIPSEVLGNVVRFLSRRSNALDWARFLSPANVVAVACVSPFLRAAAGGALNCVKSGNLYAKCRICDLSVRSYRVCRCLGTGNRAIFSAQDPDYFSIMVKHYDRQFIDLISHLGAHVAQLDFPPDQIITEAKAAAIVRHCTAMNELSVFDPVNFGLLRDIIQHRGSQLIKLKCIRNLNQVGPTIAQHCINLKEVYLRSVADLDGVIGVVGARLTALGVKDNVTEQCLNAVRDNCPNLTTVRFRCAENMYNNLVDFYISYGAQLELASFFSFNAEQCRRVVAGCTNLQVESIDINADAAAVFSALQSTVVRAAYVSYETLVTGEQHLAAAMNKCERMAGLHVFGRSFEEDDEIHLETFRLPLPSLQIFSTGYLRPNEISELAQATGALKTLCISIDFDEEAHEEIWAALERVVRFNPALAQVKLHLLNFHSVDNDSNDEDEDEDEYDMDEGEDHMWHEEQQRYIPPPPRPQRAPDEISFGVPDPEGEKFLFYLLGAFAKAQNLRELVVVSYPNVNEYWDYLYCVEEACAYFGLRHRRLSLAVLGVDYLPLEVFHEKDDDAGNTAEQSHEDNLEG